MIEFEKTNSSGFHPLFRQKPESFFTEINGVKRRKYTPHSCRHTFSTLMKAVQAPDKDKLALIGHTSTEMPGHYQDVDLESLRRITDAI